MSVTAVPLHPLNKGTIAKVWIGILLVILAGIGLAWLGTARMQYTTTESGLQYRVIRDGEGQRPGASDVALVTYTGRLEDGTVFDSNATGQPTPMPINGVVPGFSEGLQLMNKGATLRFRIPPNLAYGASGAGGVIPPNATLDFEVTLLEFRTREEIQQLMMQQMMQQQQQGGGVPGGPGGPGGGAPGAAGPGGAPGR